MSVPSDVLITFFPFHPFFLLCNKWGKTEGSSSRLVLVKIVLRPISLRGKLDAEALRFFRGRGDQRSVTIPSALLLIHLQATNSQKNDEPLYLQHNMTNRVCKISHIIFCIINNQTQIIMRGWHPASISCNIFSIDLMAPLSYTSPT